MLIFGKPDSRSQPEKCNVNKSRSELRRVFVEAKLRRKRGQKKVFTQDEGSPICKWADNINSNYKPVIVTISKKIALADGLASQAGVNDKIDIFEIEQFMAANVYELSKFKKKHRAVTVKEIIDKYNKIVSDYESDPGLKIDIE